MMGLDNFYLPQLPLNEAIRGFGVARVISSANSEYKPGELSTVLLNGLNAASGMPAIGTTFQSSSAVMEADSSRSAHMQSLMPALWTWLALRE